VNWISAQNVRPLLFRGHADATWPLLPSIARFPSSRGQFAWTTEHNAYYEFLTTAGDLLPEGAPPWTIAFAMQHHGLATRLLDWSDTFAVALHFAVSAGKGDAAVWMLNPFILNERTIHRAGIFHPSELNGDYAELFIHRTKQLDGGVAAILPLRHQP